MRSRLALLGTGVLVLFCTVRTPLVYAQQNFDNVQIQVIDVADNVYMLLGSGGNIGLSVGDDGAFIIDDQFAPLSEKIKAAIATVSDDPVRFVVNTHWHGDHTGGNENMGKAGAIIVAHENVRTRLHADQLKDAVDNTLPAPDALPVITFADALTFHWNGDDIDVFHVAPAHTDGDAVIYFKNANAVHMGDTYFNGFYPYIDVGSGGAMDGMIAAADKVLAMVDDETSIIPGHGPLSNKAELQVYRDMLAAVRDRVKAMIDEGKSQDEVVAARPTSDFDAEWGDGFMQPDQWVGIVYASMTTTP